MKTNTVQIHRKINFKIKLNEPTLFSFFVIKTLKPNQQQMKWTSRNNKAENGNGGGREENLTFSHGGGGDVEHEEQWQWRQRWRTVELTSEMKNEQTNERMRVRASNSELSWRWLVASGEEWQRVMSSRGGRWMEVCARALAAGSEGSRGFWTFH